MSDSFDRHPLPRPIPPPDSTPEAGPPPGEAAASGERRRSRSDPGAAASPAAPPPASPDREFVTHDPAPEQAGGDEPPPETASADEAWAALPPLARSGQRRRTLAPPAAKAEPLRPEQRLLLLDTWQRSGLPAADFAALVGVSKFTLFAWKKKFEQEGPAGLMDRPRGAPAGSRLPELTRRSILMLKQANPDWGCQKISDMLLRGPALPASAAAVARVLHEAGYQMEEVPTRPHPPRETRFERARPNQLWQTDLFTFILKRQNRRAYLVAFMDDHSRFIVGYGLHASQSAALVIEVLRASLTAYGAPEEVLTDNGSQYVTWRGKSAFSKELERRGVRQVVAAPRHPQTLGKIERFWGTLWRECVEAAVYVDLGDARQRIGLFIDHYNFQRPHQGIDGLVPADRFFGAAPEVRKTLEARVQANALELARHGLPKAPFYLTGQAGGRPFSVHAEGERVILTRGGGRQEIDLVPPPATAPADLPEPVCPQGVPAAGTGPGHEGPPAPGASPLDGDLPALRAALGPPQGGEA
jgi:transposase InsO family protein